MASLFEGCSSLAPQCGTARKDGKRA